MKQIIPYIRNRFNLAFRNRGMRNFSIMAAFVIFVSTFLLSLNMVGLTYEYKTGDIARESIRVPSDIYYQVEQETTIEKRFAEERVPPVFEKDSYVLAEKLKLVNSLFNSVETVITGKSSATRIEQASFLAEMLPEQLQYDSKVLHSILSYARIGELRKITLSIVNDMYEKGIVDDSSLSEIIDANRIISVRTQIGANEFSEEKRRFGDLNTLNFVRANLLNITQKYVVDLPKNQQSALVAIVKSMIRSNVRFDADENKSRKLNAAMSVKPVMDQLKKGQVIVREGDSITLDIYKKIQVINKYTQAIHVNYIAGIFLLQLLLFVIFILFSSPNFNRIVPDTRASFITMILTVSFMAFSYLMKQSMMGQDTQVIFALVVPISFIAMMLAVLYNNMIAVISGVFCVFFAYTLNKGEGDYATLAVSLTSCLLSVYGIRELERRTDFLKRGLFIGIVNSFVVCAVGLMSEQIPGVIALNVKYAIIGALCNSVCVIGLFPIFEHFFGITTVFKLYELSDLNAPLFKKMLIRAPGTYNHSIMVANMAESACREIGADFLLARVGGYYHDIGKIENAQYFIENKKNPNDPMNIPPNEYSKMIIAHVEKGIELARKNNIPESVIDFIREHHGDTMMTFFYHQALERAQETGGSESVHRSMFQYPGPKPHSKETAIVMLADAIEAASRSVQEPSYAKLETLVKKIIATRLNEGDLEESDLTLQEISGVQKAFLRVLNGIFHTRIEYPQAEQIKKLEEMVTQSAERR
jgi:putative nucleotidyltransferase with HDIG domain